MVNILNGGANSVIDRGKEDSIKAEGDGSVRINAANITLQNCGNGFRAKDNEPYWHMCITGNQGCHSSIGRVTVTAPGCTR